MNLAFTQQPTETQKGSTISPAPAVKATDTWGNVVPGATVDISQLVTISGTGGFTGSSQTSATTDASGIATFGSLAVTDVGEYKLHPTSGSASATSIAFLIANQVARARDRAARPGRYRTTRRPTLP